MPWSNFPRIDQLAYMHAHCVCPFSYPSTLRRVEPHSAKSAHHSNNYLIDKMNLIVGLEERPQVRDGGNPSLCYSTDTAQKNNNA